MGQSPRRLQIGRSFALRSLCFKPSPRAFSAPVKPLNFQTFLDSRHGGRERRKRRRNRLVDHVAGCAPKRSIVHPEVGSHNHSKLLFLVRARPGSPRLRIGEGFSSSCEAPNAVDAGGIGEDRQRSERRKEPPSRPEGLSGRALRALPPAIGARAPCTPPPKRRADTGRWPLQARRSL